MLYVGSIIPRKHLKEIVEALALLPKDLQIPLVVVGNGTTYKKEVLERIQQLSLGSNVKFLQPDYEDLAAIYQLAKLLIYPSEYEGFGLPILEALYAHIPVITALNSSLPEAGGEGALYVDKVSGERLAVAIEKVLVDQDFTHKMITKGQQHLKHFDAQNLSNQLVVLYKALV